VDLAEYRERLSLETNPSPDDIAGTYSNMRRVLEAEQYPWVRVEAQFVSANAKPTEVSASISMHGATLEFVLPVEIVVDESELTVSGRLALSQSDFGLTPFSSAGGLLRVADELQIEFELVAVRLLE
jgi:polyisoprenoid-binding protein YceI